MTKQGTDGFMLVPVEPTSEMLNACRGAWITWETNDEGGPVQKLGWRMYRAMLDAAPPPQKTEGPISQQYAAELARQVDELEAENAELLAALKAERARVVEECANIALAIDSGRGNEKEIAAAIRALAKKETP